MAASDLTALADVVTRLENATVGDPDVVKRLARVLERLERAAANLGAPLPPSDAGPAVENAEKKTPAKVEVTSFGETHAMQATSGTGLSAEKEERHPSLEDFDKISDGAIGDYFTLSSKIGPPVSDQAELVRKAFVAQRRLMKIVPQTREPGPKILNQLLAATENTLKAVKAHAKLYVATDHEIHLMGVAEGIRTLAWVTVGMVWNDQKKPETYIAGVIDYIKREYLDGIYDMHADDETQIKWADAFIQTLKELQEYVGKWHKDKIGWGTKIRGMTFWSNAIAQTAPGEGTADQYEYSTKLGAPVTKQLS
eukprot:m.49311 g.49311  ORF g.49311 m.49311 type:complete len:310 (+) comp10610_c0_seq1:281-1210(+)